MILREEMVKTNSLTFYYFHILKLIRNLLNYYIIIKYDARYFYKYYGVSFKNEKNSTIKVVSL